MVITTVSANKDIKTMDPAVTVNSRDINIHIDKNITFDLLSYSFDSEIKTNTGWNTIFKHLRKDSLKKA